MSKAKQRTPEWYLARKGRVTGSNVGAILGLDPNRTRDDVMRAMVREYHDAPKETDEFVENVVFAHGKFHEFGALIDYKMETGNNVDECGFFEYAEWLGASPDGLIVDLPGDAIGVLEIKCPYGKRKDESPTFKAAAEQPHYYAQMQIEMLCAGVIVCDFYQWAPGGSRLEVVEFSQQWIDDNLPALKAFHKQYLKERDNEDHLNQKLLEIDTAKADKLISEYDELKDAEDRAKERRSAIIEELSGMTKGRDAIICGRKFTKVEKNGSISYAKAIKKYAPDADLEPFRGKSSEYWLLS